ncbi:MAG: ribbon-helix-helix protein, CopG family [Methanomassiliicoccaceae archaeon]|jgi:CopG family nickel-responsive transcriptional regulator|nr:ribbon-helix-helix protein, CopG family [Methanomassiliicoccaceae archaeon]
MAIISISLPDEAVGSLERIQGLLGLSGRSEAVRASIRMAEAEMKDMERIDGDVEGVLIIVHSAHGDQWIGMLQHRYEQMIRTQLHSHLQNRKCLEVMILSSGPDEFKSMMNEVYRTGKADYVKFVRSR